MKTIFLVMDGPKIYKAFESEKGAIDFINERFEEESKISMRFVREYEIIEVEIKP